MNKRKELTNCERLDKIFGYTDVARRYSKSMGRYSLVRYTLPSWALCPLFNDDDSGIEHHEAKSLDYFLASEGLHLPVDSAEIGFCYTNDLDHEAGDCAWVIFLLPGWYRPTR